MTDHRYNITFLDESVTYARRHGLACALAGAAAKRAILAEHKPSLYGRRESCVDTDALVAEALVASAIGQAQFPRATIRALATPYADHPGTETT